jgi:hypothetical protein
MARPLIDGELRGLTQPPVTPLLSPEAKGKLLSQVVRTSPTPDVRWRSKAYGLGRNPEGKPPRQHGAVPSGRWRTGWRLCTKAQLASTTGGNPGSSGDHGALGVRYASQCLSQGSKRGHLVWG